MSLDLRGIRLAVIYPTGKRGHPEWLLPLEGGAVREGDLRIEVVLSIDMRQSELCRSHGALLTLCEQVEQNGGFARVGDEIHVGDAILAGRDALNFVGLLWRLAAERAGDQKAAYRQGFEAGRREAAAAVHDALTRVTA